LETLWRHVLFQLEPFRGCAFATFEHRSDAARALDQLDKSSLNGRIITVRITTDCSVVVIIAAGYCKTRNFRVPFISRISQPRQIRDNNGW